MARTLRSRARALDHASQQSARRPLAAKSANIGHQAPPTSHKKVSETETIEKSTADPEAAILIPASSNEEEHARPAKRPEATPLRSRETSIRRRPSLSISKATPSFVANFRRRPRQNSILHLIQQQAAEQLSDDEDEGFTLGTASPEDASPARPSRPSSLKRKRGERRPNQEQPSERIGTETGKRLRSDSPDAPTDDDSHAIEQPSRGDLARSTARARRRGRNLAQGVHPALLTAELEAMLPKRRMIPSRTSPDALDSSPAGSARSPTPTDSGLSGSDDETVSPVVSKRNRNMRKVSTASQTYGRKARKKKASNPSRVLKAGVADQPNCSGQEMNNAAAKFKEVDEWELDFESQDVAGGSSSPWR